MLNTKDNIMLYKCVGNMVRNDTCQHKTFHTVNTGRAVRHMIHSIPNFR